MSLPFLLGLMTLLAVLWAARWSLHKGLTPPRMTEGPTPAELGMSAETVSIGSPEPGKMFAWWIPPPAITKPAPAAVLLHGWGGDAGTLLPAAQALHQAGYAVLAVDVLNHGRSDAEDHSSMPRFARDLDRAIAWLQHRPEVDTNRLFAIGHSVGGAAVLLSASRRHDLCAVVSVSAFAHPEWMMRRWLSGKHIPYWPLGWLVNRYVEQVIGRRFADIAPMHTVSLVTCPVLLVHGRQDSTVPCGDALVIHAHQGPARVTLLEADGTHETFTDMQGVLAQVLGFLSEAAKTRARFKSG